MQFGGGCQARGPLHLPATLKLGDMFSLSWASAMRSLPERRRLLHDCVEEVATMHQKEAAAADKQATCGARAAMATAHTYEDG